MPSTATDVFRQALDRLLAKDMPGFIALFAPLAVRELFGEGVRA
ncbi:hypothetical protein [Micromonospora aurantiaca (nom. illeg.)]